MKSRETFLNSISILSLRQLYLLFNFNVGAHMRRASAELAERRRASFGSRGMLQLRELLIYLIPLISQ